MISKPLYVDVGLLEEKLDNSIYKIEHLVKEMGISRQAFANKRSGKTPFRASEVFVLCSLLNITGDERDKIFYPKGWKESVPNG